MEPDSEITRNAQCFERRGNPLRRLWFWGRSLVVQEVPPAIAACEFDCKPENCHEADWHNCANRLRQMRK